MQFRSAFVMSSQDLPFLIIAGRVSFRRAVLGLKLRRPLLERNRDASSDSFRRVASHAESHVDGSSRAAVALGSLPRRYHLDRTAVLF